MNVNQRVYVENAGENTIPVFATQTKSMRSNRDKKPESHKTETKVERVDN